MTGLDEAPLGLLDAPALTFEPATYAVHQRIRYEYSSPVTSLRQRLVVVPREAHDRQRLRSWSLTVAGVGRVDRRDRRDRFDNHVIDLAVPVVDDVVEFALEAVVDILPAGPSTRPGGRAAFLRPTTLTAVDPAIEALATAAGPDPAALCEAVFTAFRYEWGITSVTTPAAAALAGGVGVCQDYAHVMIAACRHLGIPARYVSGHLLGEGGSHAWVEVLRGRTVEAWDPTNRRRAVDGYVTVAVGRDYADVAPMSGTFCGLGVESRLAVEKSVAVVGASALSA